MTFNQRVAIVTGASSGVTVFCDPNRIGQVLSNLVKNSIDFVPDNGKEQSVQDPGKGIDVNIFPRLFSKFVTKSFQGTGLGLFICKGIIEAHGGQIWAKNKSDGHGAIFSFNLPVYDTQEKQQDTVARK